MRNSTCNEWVGARIEQGNRRSAIRTDTHKTWAKRMKNTPVSVIIGRLGCMKRGRRRSSAPSSTLVTSGDSIGSGEGTGADGSVPFTGELLTNVASREREASLTASLTMEPLNPTSETPAMTVTRDSHLWDSTQDRGQGKKQTGVHTGTATAGG